MSFEVDRVLRTITEVKYEMPVNHREQCLSKPILPLENFDGGYFLTNMEGIGRFIVENGKSVYDWPRPIYSWFLNFEDEEYIYRSSIFTKELEGCDYKRINIMRATKVDDVVDSFSFSSDGSVAISHDISIDGQVLFYDGLDKSEVDYVNTLTSDFLSKIFLFKNKESDLMADGNFYRDDTDKASLISNLRRSVILEKNRRYNLSRGISDYLSELEGLNGTFEYIEQFLKSRIVVDVGTGSGLGWFDIAKRHKGCLNFWATNLVFHKELKEMFGDRIRFTPVEFMNGFKSESLAGIVALNSVAYSSNPKMAIDQIDRVLIPGGVFKASFRDPTCDFCTMEYGFQTHERFTRYLIDLGYDVALFNGNIVLAVKPEAKKKAIDIFRKDLVDY